MTIQQRKIISLVVSSLVALASGTPYLYGIYSPQLITQCGFSALTSSYLSFATNVGSSIGGFFAGLLIDGCGTQVATALGGLLEFSGFYILYLNYRYSWHYFAFLLIAMACVGFGSVLAYFSTIKIATINFPHNKGAANACPVSAYGLAALFYASVAAILFSDNTQGLLGFIAVFAGTVIGAGTGFVRTFEQDENSQINSLVPESLVPARGESITIPGDFTPSDSNTESDRSFGDAVQGQKPFGYLLKGHRGSLAQVNLIRSDSSASLFSTVSDASSVISSSSSSSDSSPTGYGSTSSTSIPSTSSFPIDMPYRGDSFSSTPDNLVAGVRRESFQPSACSLASYSPSPQELKARQQLRMGLPSSASPVGSPGQRHNSGVLSFSARPKVIPPKGIRSHHSSSSTKNSDSAISFSPSDSPGKHSSLETFESNHLMEKKSFQSTPTTTIAKNSPKLADNTSKHQHHHHKKHISAKDHVISLLTNKLFLLHYVLNAFYCSIGQVYIFSVGFIVKAQVNESRDNLLETTFFTKMAGLLSKNDNMAASYQALQVSVISFANFLGRLLAGPLSDFFSKSLKKSRIWVIIIALSISILGQISMLIFNGISALSISSLLIGTSYGAIYGIMPAVVADTFGSRNFATTWALIGTGPITIFLLLSNYFGKDYDNHSELVDDGHDGLTKMCLKGASCYRNVFVINTFICCILFVGYLTLIKVGRAKSH